MDAEGMPPANVKFQRSVTGREVAVAFGILTLTIAVFLWKPLSSGEYYAPGDVAQMSGFLSQSPVESPNIQQIDVTVDFLPWQRFQTQELRAGRIPSWNPYNGSGVPHLGNMQSAVFSPFNVPYYFLSMRVALLVSAYLILITAGMLTYALARHLRLSPLGSLVAAMTYVFSAFMVLWLRWPLGSVGAFIPGVLWASSAALGANRRRERVRWALALSVFVAGAILAGHPETLAFGFLPVIFWCGAWLRNRRCPPAEAAKRILSVAVGVTLGVALAAVQVLPFLQYLSRSPSSSGRSVAVFASWHWLVAQVYPLFAGSPAMQYRGPYSLALPFHEVVELYVGSLALLLAVIGIVSVRWTKRRAPWVFFGFALVITVYVYDAAHLGRILSALPGFSLVMPSRSAVIWALSVAVLAGFGVDGLAKLSTMERSVSVRKVVAIVAGGFAGAVITLGIAWYLYQNEFTPPRGHRFSGQMTARHHVVFVLGTFVLGLAAISVTVLAKPRHLKRLAGCSIAAIVFLQGGFMLRGQNPSVPEAKFMHFPDRVEHIATLVGDNQTLWADNARIIPDLNLWLRVRSPANYDVLDLDSYQKLYRSLLHPPAKLVVGGAQLGMLDGPVHPDGLKALQVMGIRRVVSGGPYPFQVASRNGRRIGTTRTADPPTFSFTTDAEGRPADTVFLHLGNVASGESFRVTFRGANTVTTKTLSAYQGSIIAALPESVSRAHRFTVSAQAVSPSLRSAKFGYAYAKSIWSRTPGLRLIGGADTYLVFAVPGPSGVAFSPRTVVPASNGRAALETILDPSFDPATQAVVEDRSSGSGDASTRPASGVVRTLATKPAAMTFEVTRSSPGYLVIDQNLFPGWQATVDAVPTRIVRANSTFMAVKVPAGKSVVHLQFRSNAIRTGGIISIGAFVTLVVVGLSSVVRTPARRARDMRADQERAR